MPPSGHSDSDAAAAAEAPDNGVEGDLRRSRSGGGGQAVLGDAGAAGMQSAGDAGADFSQPGSEDCREAMDEGDEGGEAEGADEEVDLVAWGGIDFMDAFCGTPDIGGDATGRAGGSDGDGDGAAPSLGPDPSGPRARRRATPDPPGSPVTDGAARKRGRDEQDVPARRAPLSIMCEPGRVSGAARAAGARGASPLPSGRHSGSRSAAEDRPADYQRPRDRDRDAEQRVEPGREQARREPEREQGRDVDQRSSSRGLPPRDAQDWARRRDSVPQAVRPQDNGGSGERNREPEQERPREPRERDRDFDDRRAALPRSGRDSDARHAAAGDQPSSRSLLPRQAPYSNSTLPPVSGPADGRGRREPDDAAGSGRDRANPTDRLLDRERLRPREPADAHAYRSSHLGTPGSSAPDGNGRAVAAPRAERAAEAAGVGRDQRRTTPERPSEDERGRERDANNRRGSWLSVTCVHFALRSIGYRLQHSA